MIDTDLVIYLHQQRPRMLRKALLARVCNEVESRRDHGLCLHGITFEDDPDVTHLQVDGLSGFCDMAGCGVDGQESLRADNTRKVRKPINCPRCLILVKKAGGMDLLQEATQAGREPDLEEDAEEERAKVAVANPFYR